MSNRLVDRLDFTINKERGIVANRPARSEKYDFLIMLDRAVNLCRKDCTVCTVCSTFSQGADCGN